MEKDTRRREHYSLGVLGDWVARLGALETAIGLFTQMISIVTFVMILKGGALATDMKNPGNKRVYAWVGNWGWLLGQDSNL